MIGRSPTCVRFLAVLLTAWPVVTPSAGPPAPAIASPTGPAVLFVALNVADLDRSLDFYIRALGMKETERFGAEPNARAEPIEVVLRFDDTANGAFLLLSHQRGQKERRDLGDGFSRLAFVVPAVSPLVQRVRAAGYPVKLSPKSIPEVGVIVALVTDPDGYTVEFVEFTGPQP